MVKLSDILTGIELLQVMGTLEGQISEIAFDSRNAIKNSLFVAVKGTQVDGHDFIEQAIERGSSAVICEQFPKHTKEEINYLKVSDSALALGIIAANFYDNPSSKINLVGITGTNGKTTTASLLYKLFKQLGYEAGLISTLSNRIGERIIDATHTTPDALQIQSMLREMVYSGCEYAFMEVSSHAIEQKRIAGTNFTGAIFTNITHDHLDYHQTFNAYLDAKRKLFDDLSTRAFALSNADDRNGRIVLQNSKAHKYTYALKAPADFKCRILENHFSGMHLKLDGKDLHTLLTGRFNAYNLLAVYATAKLLGQGEDDVLTALSTLQGAEGRFELVKSKANITGIVDYAHSPDALKNILESINELRTKNEELITVVGAGGDRDKSKRPIMADVASRLSNRLILTSDNPRSEDPDKILEEMLSGITADKVNKTLVISNRKEAIKTAVALAQQGDVILVAGKGHEKYQEVKGVRHPFDDKQLLTEFLEKR